MKGPIQAVEVSYFVHATEDVDRIDRKVREALGVGSEPELDELEGHFGNKILHVRYHSVGEEAARVVGALASGLPRTAKDELSRTIENNIDEHQALYLRLHKQLLMAGELGFSTADTVRVKVKPRLFLLRGGAPELYRTVLKLDE